MPCHPIPLLQDLETYHKSAQAIAKKYFVIPELDEYYRKKDARPLIFCNFARGLADKSYDEVRCTCNLRGGGAAQPA